jgi:Phage lysozyme
MRDKTLVNRIKRIQKHLDLEPDGIIGSDTLTAIENRLFSKTAALDNSFSLTISRTGLDQLVAHEISSKAYFNKRLKSPVWPGGGSGLTIGIGYDLGYNSRSQIEKDWQGKVSDVSLEKLKKVSGLKGEKAQKALYRVKTVVLNYDVVRDVFAESTLPRYALSTRKAFPGIEDLYPDAQSALLSLVYNRGTSISGSRRKEMAAIKPLVQQKDYVGMANEIRNMKRLWRGKGLDGLLKRRDDEARLLEKAHRKYVKSSLIRV